MRKNILFFVLFLLVAVNAFADQTLNARQPREYNQAPSTKPELSGKDYSGNATSFAQIVSTGLQAIGNAGFIALQSQDISGNNITYYLWVDASSTTVGVLKMASFANIKTFSSFPWGDWRSSSNFNAGIKVSAQ